MTATAAPPRPLDDVLTLDRRGHLAVNDELEARLRRLDEYADLDHEHVGELFEQLARARSSGITVLGDHEL